ncbi:MAG: hypothetical protein ABIF40_01455 [archaeon]
MTVGLCLSNGKEAFVLTDRLRSQNTEGGYHATKQSSKFGKKSSLILSCSGNSDLNQLLHEEDMTFGSLDDFNKIIHGFIENYFHDYLVQSERGKKSFLINLSDKGHKKGRKREHLKLTQKEIDEVIQHTSMVVGVENNKIRIYQVNVKGPRRLKVQTLNKHGSGMYMARRYLNSFMSGVNFESLSNQNMALHIMSAYSYAQLMTSVGGTPDLHSIDTKGTIYNYNLAQRCAMSNVASARMVQTVGLAQARWMFDSIFQEKDYDDIARTLNLTETTLTTTTIPYLSWQERVNHKQ